MNVFELRQRLVDDYADYTRSFVVIRDEHIHERVDDERRGSCASGGRPSR